MPKLTIPSAARFSAYIAAAVMLAVTAMPAQAYMGAGAGLSAIGSILSFIGVLLLMVLGFVWYPAKRMLKKMRAKDAPQQTGQGE